MLTSSHTLKVSFSHSLTPKIFCSFLSLSRFTDTGASPQISTLTITEFCHPWLLAKKNRRKNIRAPNQHHQFIIGKKKVGLCNVFFPPKKLPSNATDIYSIIIQTQNSPITEILHLVKKKKKGRSSTSSSYRKGGKFYSHMIHHVTNVVKIAHVIHVTCVNQ